MMLPLLTRSATCRCNGSVGGGWSSCEHVTAGYASRSRFQSHLQDPYSCKKNNFHRGIHRSNKSVAWRGPSVAEKWALSAIFWCLWWVWIGGHLDSWEHLLLLLERNKTVSSSGSPQLNGMKKKTGQSWRSLLLSGHIAAWHLLYQLLHVLLVFTWRH